MQYGVFMNDWTCDSEHDAPNARIPALMQCLVPTSIDPIRILWRAWPCRLLRPGIEGRKCHLGLAAFAVKPIAKVKTLAFSSEGPGWSKA